MHMIYYLLANVGIYTLVHCTDTVYTMYTINARFRLARKIKIKKIKTKLRYLEMYINTMFMNYLFV